MFTKTNLGGEESEQSLPSWISDHLGAKSYIDETSQSPSSPPPNSPKMDTSSLTKEGNVMTQAELDKLGSTYSFPSGIRLRIPGDGETILSARQGEVPVLPQPPTRFGVVLLQGEARQELAPRIAEQCERVEDKVLLRLGGRVGVPFGHGRQQYSASSQILGNAREELQQVANSVRGGRQEDRRGLREDRARRLLRGVEGTGFADLLETLCGWLHGALYQWRRQHGLGRRGRAHPGIPDETILRWLGGKVKDSFTNLLSGMSGSSSDSGSVFTSDSELPPELRSDAMSARGKAKAEKATKTTAKPPTKGVVIREKRTREGDPLIEIGEPDASKGKEAVPPPPPKRFKSNRGTINARGRAVGAGTSSHGGDVGSESMSDASVARKLLTRVVVFASSLALRSQENLHEIDFQMARADSAELELVKTQNRALKAENKLAELSEEGSKPGNEVGDLKATVAELTKKLAKAKELAIEDFKASGEFKAAVTDSAATYFSEGFEFCKRQLLHQFQNLGVDVANMAMDPSFAEEEEAAKEGEDPVAGAAPNV
ncbi:hypothetical protein Acr_00g0028560 [Actinidia rufa]|uniref:Uncharacterized protein n=1 Tax=Actinidia rufa TaxID=165716 RepID=A0A7J0DEA3_9ERIC|nr:hypothetical protein Acr_00g0028560 [Actinidia rufa]